jgi:transcriptional regulator NrdR family protein
MSGRNQWMRFTCYFCATQMDGVSQTQVMRDGKEYIKTGYKCTQCGYKLVTYVSREQALSIVDEKCLPSALV